MKKKADQLGYVIPSVRLVKWLSFGCNTFLVRIILKTAYCLMPTSFVTGCQAHWVNQLSIVEAFLQCPAFPSQLAINSSNSPLMSTYSRWALVVLHNA
nr:hypothetical protein B456_004G031800 [Ipomoea batatas]